ncbi:MAG: hypothetical protein H6838_02640 [Planctomycetes bacterium]|nr:hypothetical protein [Planctomycetota bacterium]
MHPATSARPAGRSRAIAALRSVMGVALLAVAVVAQGAPAKSAVPQPAPITSVALSLQSIYQAPLQQDHTMVQRRRFFSGQGLIATVREQLIVDANGTPSPNFELSYISVEGQLPGSPADLQWAQTYATHAKSFYLDASFHIRDLAQAQQNYTLHSFAPVVRANRSATRVVIFPARLDKAIWVVDVDMQTSLPLYAAEFDRQFRLLSEVEVLSCVLTAQLPPSPPSSSTVVSTVYNSFSAALTQFESADALVEPDSLSVGEYQLSSVSVREDLLNQRRSLQLTYTDGVDEFFVIEEPGAAHPFAGLPSQQGAAGANANTIARYSDHSMRVLLFWEDGVSFQLAGRGALARLDAFARDVYTKALLD